MSIQKKSLLSGISTTKKAIVATSTTTSQGTPSVSAPVSARLRPKVAGLKVARLKVARIQPRVVAKKAAKKRGLV
jgi:hypothetical protein